MTSDGGLAIQGKVEGVEQRKEGRKGKKNQREECRERIGSARLSSPF